MNEAHTALQAEEQALTWTNGGTGTEQEEQALTWTNARRFSSSRSWLTSSWYSSPDTVVTVRRMVVPKTPAEKETGLCKQHDSHKQCCNI